MEQFTQQMIQRLDALASKLGMAASAIWGFYLRQSKVEGISDLVCTLACLLVSAILGGVVVWVSARRKEWLFGSVRKGDENCYGLYRSEAGKRVGGHVGFMWLIAPAILFAVFSLLFAREAFTELYNPGYFAFQQILEQLHQ